MVNEREAVIRAEIEARAERLAEKREQLGGRVASLGSALVELAWNLGERLEIPAELTAEYVESLESAARRLAVRAASLDFD